MSLAEETRTAVHRRPYLLTALREGIVNYAAAARTLGLSEDTEAVATALRRYAEQLPPATTESRHTRVSMRTNLDDLQEADLLNLTTQTNTLQHDAHTGVIVEGDVDAIVLEQSLAILHANQIKISAAGVAGDQMVLILDRQDAAHAIRLVEEVLDEVRIPASRSSASE